MKVLNFIRIYAIMIMNMKIFLSSCLLVIKAYKVKFLLNPNHKFNFPPTHLNLASLRSTMCVFNAVLKVISLSILGDLLSTHLNLNFPLFNKLLNLCSFWSFVSDLFPLFLFLFVCFGFVGKKNEIYTDLSIFFLYSIFVIS